MIEIVKDRELIYETDNYDVILVGTSIYCMLTGGFQSKMRFKYPFLEVENDKTPYADKRKLGTRLTLNQKPIISLMYICNYPRVDCQTIDYTALEKCLLSANAEFKGMKVASTMIGMTQFDGNGDKDRCMEIIKECTNDMYLTLFDYKQRVRREEINSYKKYVNSLKTNNYELYNELIKQQDEYFKKHYLK